MCADSRGRQCDTFARSAQAVFELSTRFAENFEYAAGADEATKLQAKKLVFHELTQICLWGNCGWLLGFSLQSFECVHSDRPVTAHQRASAVLRRVETDRRRRFR
jgi:hypothetical protein